MALGAWGSALRVGSALGLLMAATAAANAGGFAIREMSSYGQGSSYAGVAAGGDLSTMFWNPATLTQVPGIQAEAVATGVFPYAANTPGAGTFAPALLLGGTGNTADDAFVPSGYFSYQINPKLWLGASINAPFGLSVNFPTGWAGGQYAAGSTSLKTYNFTPSIAYRINDMISVGVGVQVQYAKADLNHCVTAPCGLGAPLAELSGNGWAYGFTAGVTLTPTPTTTIGLGYRSALDQKIDGSLAISGIGTASASTTINLPDTVSLGLRQRFTSRWTGLATVEWTNWSRIGTSNVAAGAFSTTLPFQYQDGWLFSVGAEYQWNDRLAVRGGVGYEISPITDDVRIPLLPDNDRTWLSVGATYKVTNALSLDFAYSHLFVKDTSIDISSTTNPWYTGVAYVGTVASHIDIVSVALKYRFDAPTKMARAE
jgi:long-chain fatty acid transport protein